MMFCRGAFCGKLLSRLRKQFDLQGKEDTTHLGFGRTDKNKNAETQTSIGDIEKNYEQKERKRLKDKPELLKKIIELEALAVEEQSQLDNVHHLTERLEIRDKEHKEL